MRTRVPTGRTNPRGAATIAVLALATVLLAGSVAPAFADVPTVTLSVDPSEITYLDTVTLTATAVGADSDTATLERRYESAVVTESIATSTSANGVFVFTDTPDRKAYYRVAVGSAASDPTAVVLVHTLLNTPQADSTSIKGGGTLHAFGSIRPKHPITPPADVLYRVYFEKYNEQTAGWETPPYLASDDAHVTQIINSDTSKWEYSRAFSNDEAGLWRVRFWHECPRHIETYSPPLEFTVSPYTEMPVYRFYNLGLGVHFYTASETEKQSVIKNLAGIYKYEGVGYTANSANPANAYPLYRFYNLKTGVHFYTADETEKANVIKNLSATYKFEGTAYKVSKTSGSPVYRFYNLKKGVHFYTASETEKQNVINTLSTTYKYEGVGYRIGQ